MPPEYPNLTTCIECGRKISRSAQKCPNPECAATAPFGIECLMCGKTAKCSESYTSERESYRVQSRNEGMPSVYHKSCFDTVYGSTVAVRCRDCGEIVHAPPFQLETLITLAKEARVVHAGRTPCPTCGCQVPIPIPVCPYCSLPVFTQSQKTANAHAYSYQHMGHTHRGSVERLAHAFCYEQHNGRGTSILW
jgi:hypothetical protein